MRTRGGDADLLVRTADRSRRLPAGIGVAIAVASAALLAFGPARPAPDPGPVRFEVVRRGGGDQGHLGRLLAATSDAELTDLWTTTGLPGAPEAIDFDRRVAVSITIPDDACPPELAGFVRDGERISPTFQEPPGGCFKPLISRVFVVAIDRASVRPAFELRLPGQPVFGFDEQRLRVEL